MGIGDVIQLATLAVTVGGGVWASFSALTKHLNGFRSDMAIFGWRLARIERELGLKKVEE